MSLDINLTEDTCPCCGRGGNVYWANITHNLTPMAREAGIYEILWRNNGTEARALVAPLAEATAAMRADPARFQAFDSPNGWGTYANFLPWLERLHDACVAHPTARVGVDV